MEARVGIEPTHKGFADLSLTTWVPRPSTKLTFSVPAGNCPSEETSRLGEILEHETEQFYTACAHCVDCSWPSLRTPRGSMATCDLTLSKAAFS